MKKIGLLISTLVIGGSFLLSGCGSNDAAGDQASKVTLNFSFWGDTLEKDSIDKLIKNFNESQDEIQVKAQQIPYDNYMEKLNTQASTKTLPDVGYMVETSTAEWGKSGNLRDLTELYESGGPFENKIAETRSEYNGKVFGSPAGPGMLTLFYSTKYFEEKGVEVPPHDVNQAWDWDKFVSILKELTVDRNGNHPGDAGFDEKNIKTYGISNFTGLGYESFLISNGGGVLSQDGKQILIGTDASIEALEKIQDLMYKDYVMPKPSQASTIPSTDTAMLTDRVAMTITGSWDLRSLGDAIEQKGLALGMGVLPKMGKVVQMNFGPPIVVFDNENTQEHWEETKTFLEYLLDPENSLDVIDSGLWLPNQDNWFSDETYLQKWAVSDRSPEYKKEALVEAKEQALTKNKAFYSEDAASIEQIVNPALEQVWTGKKAPREVVEEDILPKLEKQFGDKYEYVK